MKITTKSTHTSLTPAISEYVEKKIGGLSKFVTDDEAAHAAVELELTTRHHQESETHFRAEVNIHGTETHVRAEAHGRDLYQAIDLVRDEAYRQLTSQKKKRLQMLRRGGQRIKAVLKGFYNRRGKVEDDAAESVVE